ncbi:MAG TPA: hypothetical protein VI704_03480, partial [Bacteroidota bacterium]|nr:hypothetical protein [Bacteroidota bacterium]
MISKEKRLLLFVLSFLFSLINHNLEAQPRVLAIEELPLGTDHAWQNPRFSPTGKSIFFTSQNFHGIWEFSLESRAVRQVTSDPHSGFGYAVSPDGKTIAYRSTTILPSHKRKQEIVITDVERAEKHVVDSGEDVSTPTFADKKLMYAKGGWAQELDVQVPTEDIQILGIENTKIVILRGAQRVVLDPFGSGSYIWP